MLVSPCFTSHGDNSREHVRQWIKLLISRFRDLKCTAKGTILGTLSVPSFPAPLILRQRLGRSNSRFTQTNSFGRGLPMAVQNVWRQWRLGGGAAEGWRWSVTAVFQLGPGRFQRLHGRQPRRLRPARLPSPASVLLLDLPQQADGEALEPASLAGCDQPICFGHLDLLKNVVVPIRRGGEDAFLTAASEDAGIKSQVLGQGRGIVFDGPFGIF